MKKIILFVAVSVFVVSVYAQNSSQNEYEEWKPSQDEYSDFDIGKYYTPDIVRNQLDFQFAFYSSTSLNDNFYPNWDERNVSSYFTGNITSSFSHYVNTRKQISRLTGVLSVGGDYTSQKKEETFTDSKITTINKTFNSIPHNSFNLGWSNQWYFSNLFFMDYGIYSRISYNFSHYEIKNQTEDINQKQKDFSLDLSPRVGIGYGRIEHVHDARQAVYIANALSKKKVLTRNLSSDELFELSQIISTVKNKRFLDARLHLIEEITTVDSFFERNDLLADNGAAYFTTLYDMWQYGDLFPRKSGYEISFGARPFYRIQNIKYTPAIREVISHSNQHLIGVNFSYEKPVKLKWQHSLYTDVYGGFNSSTYQNKETGKDTRNDSKHKSIVASAGYSLGYYPNTRTNIQLTASQRILKNVYDDEGNEMFSYSMLGASLYYYFSPNLRLSGDYRLMYEPTRSNRPTGYFADSNRLSSWFNVQLTYSVF